MLFVFDERLFTRIGVNCNKLVIVVMKTCFYFFVFDGIFILIIALYRTSQIVENVVINTIRIVTDLYLDPK